MTAPDVSDLGPYKFCPFCGSPLSVSRKEASPRRWCELCDRLFYHNPVPAAGGVIREGDRVLLVKRKYPPREGAWTLPAGFLEYHETPIACAEREVSEETGLMVKAGALFGVYAGHDDPRQRAVLILYHMHRLGGTLRPGDDALEAQFFERSHLPFDIAFEAHRQALEDLFVGEASRPSKQEAH